MEREEKKKRKRKYPDSKLFYSTCMSEELWVRKLWFIAIQQNYSMIFHLSTSYPESRSYWKSQNGGKGGRGKGRNGAEKHQAEKLLLPQM